MFDIQVQWGARWVTVAQAHTVSEGEWMVGLWRQQYQCCLDPFRVIEHIEPTLVVGPSDPQFSNKEV